jgi:predicted component of type VI protein secretion system
MRESAVMKEPMLRPNAEQVKHRDGIVVSTVMRLTTTDGRTFEEASKAMEHEAFYQILKQLVKDLGWQDSEETASFAMSLARHYQSLLPLLIQLEKEAETLRSHLQEFQRSI